MNANYFLILIGIGIISSGLIISNTQFSFAQLHGCDKPFVDELVPKWLDEVRICFEDQDKIFELDQDITIHMYAETNEPAEWIRIHFFHSSQTGFFEEDGIERQNIKDVRIKESPHIINLQDNERIFGTDLEDAINFTINCNEPPCKKSYEQERVFQFSFPGTYYYEITMQTPDAENIYSHYPGIEVFKVLNYDEQLQMKANESILSEKLEQPIPKNDELVKDDPFDRIYFFGAIASIIAVPLAIIAILRSKHSNKSQPNLSEKKISTLSYQKNTNESKLDQILHEIEFFIERWNKRAFMKNGYRREIEIKTLWKNIPKIREHSQKIKIKLNLLRKAHSRDYVIWQSVDEIADRIAKLGVDVESVFQHKLVKEINKTPQDKINKLLSDGDFICEDLKSIILKLEKLRGTLD